MTNWTRNKGREKEKELPCTCKYSPMLTSPDPCLLKPKETQAKSTLRYRKLSVLKK